LDSMVCAWPGAATSSGAVTRVRSAKNRVFMLCLSFGDDGCHCIAMWSAYLNRAHPLDRNVAAGQAGPISLKTCREAYAERSLAGRSHVGRQCAPRQTTVSFRAAAWEDLAAHGFYFCRADWRQDNYGQDPD